MVNITGSPNVYQLNKQNTKEDCQNADRDSNVVPTVMNKGIVGNYEIVSDYEIVIVDDDSEGQSEDVDHNGMFCSCYYSLCRD